MKPSGTFPTPYGVEVTVFENPDDREGCLFSAEAAAICAGIYDPKERARFEADAKATGVFRMAHLEEYGGSTLLRVPLPRPKDSAAAQAPRDPVIRNVLENWTDIVMDRFRWCDRSGELLSAIAQNFGNNNEMIEVRTLAIRIMLTVALEHLAEREIDCIEAAAFYALSVHDEWSAAGISWLNPVKDTWWRDWVAKRPDYVKFARRCRRFDEQLPKWIKG